MEKLTPKAFFNKILNGLAMGIVIGLIPSAILGEIFKALAHYPLFAMLSQNVSIFSFAVPLLVGLFTGSQFKFQGIETASLMGACFIAGGSLRLVDGTWTLKGTGDLINVMLIACVSVLIIRWYNNRLANLGIVVIPLLGGVLPGFIGQLSLPFVSKLTTALGLMIANFTTLQPFFMMVLIAISFALIIVTPLSTVAIAYAISLAGLGAGAGNIGVVATLFTLVYGSAKVNAKGTTFALFFAGPKMMMPNFLGNPIMILPIVINATVCAIAAYFFQIQGTTASAGFGLTGLSGPINAYAFMDHGLLINIIIILIQFLVIPIATAAITHELFVKMNLYTNEIYHFTSEGK